MGRSKRGGTSRKSAEQQPGPVWDTESKVDQYDGRERLQSGSEGEEVGGHWNRITTRRAVVNSKDHVREIK